MNTGVVLTTYGFVLVQMLHNGTLSRLQIDNLVLLKQIDFSKNDNGITYFELN